MDRIICDKTNKYELTNIDTWKSMPSSKDYWLNSTESKKCRHRITCLFKCVHAYVWKDAWTRVCIGMPLCLVVGRVNNRTLIVTHREASGDSTRSWFPDQYQSRLPCSRGQFIRCGNANWDIATQVTKSIYLIHFFPAKNKVWLRGNPFAQQNFTLRRCKSHPEHACIIIQAIEKNLQCT